MIQRVCGLIKMRQPERNRGLLFASGTVVPSEGDDGYQTSCVFQKTDATGATPKVYINEGTVTSCNFQGAEGGDIGAFAASGSTDGSVLLSATDTSGFAVFSGLASDPGSGTMARSIRSRLVCNTSGNIEAETYGLQGQLVVKSSNLGHWHGGVLGTIECQTALSVYNPLAGVGALVGRVGGSTITVQSSCYLAGVIALASAVGVSNGGVYAGLYVTKTSGASSFSHGAYIENADIGVEVLACTTGTLFSGVTPTVLSVQDVGTTSSHVIDMIDAYTGMVLETGSYASGASRGVTLTTDNARPVSFVFDDGGAVLGSGTLGNYRAVLSRVYLASTQTGQVAIRAIRGQVKMADGLDMTIGTSEFGSINGVEGYMEMAGATTRVVGASTRVAALHSLTEIRQSVTLTTGGKVCGVLVELAQANGKSVSGIGSAGVAVDRVAAGHTDVQVAWTCGFVVGASSCATGLYIDSCATAAISINGDQTVGVLFNVDAAADDGLKLSVDTAITLGEGIEMSGAGTITTGINISVTACTSGILISSGSLDDGIKISGTTPVDGVEVSSACSAAAFNVSGTSAVGLLVSGACTTAAISISGNQVIGILYDVDDDATDGLKMSVDTLKTLGEGIEISGAGTVTTGITLSMAVSTTGILISAAACVTGISITAGSLTDGIKVSGATPVDGVEVSSVCSGGAFHVSDASASGLLVAGSCTTAAINITAANLNCIKSVFNVGAQLGQYVQGIKMEHTRSADIQPSTGGWWGAQIVLNAGTGYTALDKTAYVLHCVFKGDATDPSAQTVNVGRFETQSNGKVEDLLFVSANAGSTVEGDVARFVAHVAPTRAILAVQNGTTGSTPMGICVDVDETMTTGIQFNTGAALTNLFQITAAANTAYFLIADAEAGCLPNYSSAGSAIANLKVKIGSTDGYIKIYDAA